MTIFKCTAEDDKKAFEYISDPKCADESARKAAYSAWARALVWARTDGLRNDYQQPDNV